MRVVVGGDGRNDEEAERKRESENDHGCLLACLASMSSWMRRSMVLLDSSFVFGSSWLNTQGPSVGHGFGHGQGLPFLHS